MNQTIQIEDIETGKVYRVPEDMDSFLDEHSIGLKRDVDEAFLFIAFCKNEWIIQYRVAPKKLIDIFHLNPSRFRLSFSGMIPEGKITEAFAKILPKCYIDYPPSHYGMLKLLADEIGINLHPEDEAVSQQGE